MSPGLNSTMTQLTIASATLLAGLAVAGAEPVEEASNFFERKIRPVLVDNCFECHGEKKQKGELRLDSIEAILAGGESGPALVPGQPEQSRLIKGVSYADPDFQMPPKKRLTERQVADLTLWIKQGAHWPSSPAGSAVAKSRTSDPAAKDQTWWSFQPIKRPTLPQLPQTSTNDTAAIDAFVLADLQKRNIEPNPRATKRELIRRAYFDLIGVPPTYEEVTAFETDKSPDAYERLLDRLLAMPQYGERWGRHWLDVVRFAQTTGYERDGEKPFAWRYRDYVIKAFNEDKPYDQFIKEQLAGDELPQVTNDSLIATGFFRLGVYDDEPADKQMAIFDEYDDYISTTGAAFLGLTLGCARCHDHKFDPIPQSDYYSLLAFFRGVRGYEAPKFTHDSAAFVPLADPDIVKRWHAELDARLKPVEEKLAVAKVTVETFRKSREQRQAELKKLQIEPGTATTDEASRSLTSKVASLKEELTQLDVETKSKSSELQKLQEEADKIRNDKAPWEWALAVKEKEGKPDPTHILVRGNPLSPAAEVQPAFLSAFDRPKPRMEEKAGTRHRLALAEWMASADHPLTARVMANRIWKHHFGRGLVRTTTDFGHAGALPTNQPLLDWLAAEFISNGWSIKNLHRMIMLSETYRRSSRADNEQAARIDPANDLLWRQNLHRLEAEAIRDTVLHVSGKLNLKPGGRGFFPRLAGEVIAGASRPGLDWETSSEDEESRRSVYTFIKRTMLAPSLQSFDYSTTDSPLGERPTTTVAPQSLVLLNDSFMQKQAAAFARRLTPHEGDGLAFQVRRAYQLALGRNPTQAELKLALDLVEKQSLGFEQLGHRITFRPDVPESIYNAYQDKLHAEDHLVGPRDGWSYFRGDWSRDYEGIRTVDRVRGPFALWTGGVIGDGVIRAKVMLHRAVEFASILFRASATNHIQSGYELALDARQQKLVLRRHTTNVTTLAEAPAPITAASHDLKIELLRGEIRVWLDDNLKPLIVATDMTINQPGSIGVRTWGAAVSLDKLSINANGETLDAIQTTSRTPEELRKQAIESLCLALLNLNELVYVD